MKILVTGASGFVGKYVVDKLLQTDHEVIIAGRQHYGSSASRKVDFKQLDLDHIDTAIDYFEYLGKPDLAIHLAWQGLPNYTQLFHFETNLFAHYQFLKNLVCNGLSSLTVTGTCFEYGMQQGMLEENMASLPDNAYSLAKFTLYRFLTELQKHTPFKLTWMRLFYMYGVGQSSNSLFSQLTKALERGDQSFNMSGGEQVRDFSPVDTVAVLIVAAALQKEDAGIVNCCSGTPVKVKDWVLQFLKKEGRFIHLNLGYYPYAPYEPMAFWGNTEKLKRLINI